MQDRDCRLRLLLDHADVGQAYISVLVKGVRKETLIATVIRGQNGWLVHHPEDGPLYEFRVIPEDANFLAFGDAKCCRRSWIRAPWMAPAETRKWVPRDGRE